MSAREGWFGNQKIINFGQAAFVVVFASALVTTQPRAQSLDEATGFLLGDNCLNFQQGVSTRPLPGLGPQLSNICDAGGGSTPGVGGTASGQAGTVATQTSLAVFERLRTAREAEGGQSASAVGGASADVTSTSLTSGLNLWFSAGASALDHNRNRFEDAYDAVQPIFTAGADYRFMEWLWGGLAFNYINVNGDYESGGHFDSDSYGPLLYATLTPLENTFVDVVFGYTRQNNFKTRDAGFVTEVGGTTETFGGRASADYNANIWNASTLFGYDYPIDSFTIGPRLGINYIFYDINNFEEDGNTGLEVQYTGLSRSSLQSTLGGVATAAFSFPFGVVVPQISASWIHEYLLDARNAEGQFVQDLRPDPTQFKFTYYESPDRNYALIGAGVTVVLPNNWKPFVNFTTIQANDNITTYGGVAGLRVGL